MIPQLKIPTVSLNYLNFFGSSFYKKLLEKPLSSIELPHAGLACGVDRIKHTKIIEISQMKITQRNGSLWQMNNNARFISRI